jgi:hypothetical protein
MAIIKIRNAAIDLDAAEIPNLDAAKITTGTFADARISASSVSQHATSFDDNKIVNDISTLALRQASDQNKVAYNTNSSFVDVFQDATGIDTTTNTGRSSDEYMSSTSFTSGAYSTDSYTQLLAHYDGSDGSTATLTDSGEVGFTLTMVNEASLTTSNKKFGTASLNLDGVNDYSRCNVGAAPNNFQHGTNDFTYEAWVYSTGTTSAAQVIFQAGSHDVAGEILIKMYSNNTINCEFRDTSNAVQALNGTAINFNEWTHIAKVRDGGTLRLYINGTQVATKTISTSLQFGNTGDLYIGAMPGYAQYWKGQLDEVRVSKGICRYPNGTSFTPNNVPTFNATGNFTGTTITAPSSVSSMGAIITYQDNAGTNALNTDIVLQLSADGGSNYSTATLTALPDFSTGIKMAKVNDLAVTAGTNLKYKISFANQAEGSKEARIRGVALQY